MTRTLSLLILSLCLTACSATSTPTQNATLGQPGTMAELLNSLKQPGVIEFEKYATADWAVNLSGLVNLEHPKAQAAGLEDRLEQIQIFTYSLAHPTQGTYLVDSGLSQRFLDIDNNSDVSMLVKLAMGVDTLKVHLTTDTLNDQLAGVDGVFLTHIHLDHIMGLTDLSSDVPVYIGPGDAAAKDPMNVFTKGTTDRLMAKVEALLEWQYTETGIIDVFGDGSLWAIHSPGHTPGATAYLANTTSGPQLMLGDASHTKWGWENNVEPGTFSVDVAASVASLARLKALVAEDTRISAHPGHQAL
ncbi:MAG: N-acyl homoserine lactone hydrolase [Sulfitobacter sp.]|jgi:N-acyl homoserine lactone hydrolase